MPDRSNLYLWITNAVAECLPDGDHRIKGHWLECNRSPMPHLIVCILNSEGEINDSAFLEKFLDRIDGEPRKQTIYGNINGERFKMGYVVQELSRE